MPLVIIPCRSGSVEIPQKNFRPLGGQPLWSWTAGQARGLGWPTVISTDVEGRRLFGDQVWFHKLHLRSPDCPDSMYAVVEDVLRAYQGNPVVLLQPTSPFRRLGVVRDAVRLLEDRQADSVVSVAAVPRTQCPDYLCRLDQRNRLVPWDQSRMPPVRRQDARQAYVRTGDVYVFWRETLRQGDLYGSACLPIEVPYDEALSIDTAADWARAEARLQGELC